MKTRQIKNLAVCQLMLALILLPVSVLAWNSSPYPGWQYPPGFTDRPGPWLNYPGYYPGYGPYYGYRQPRWDFYGRINRYGDYDFEFRMKNFNMNDLYHAWQLFRYYQQY